MLANSFPETNTTSHPINKYRPTDQNFVPDCDVYIFSIVPAIANVQIIENTIHDSVERIGTSINGV